MQSRPLSLASLDSALRCLPLRLRRDLDLAHALSGTGWIKNHGVDTRGVCGRRVDAQAVASGALRLDRKF